MVLYILNKKHIFAFFMKRFKNEKPNKISEVKIRKYFIVWLTSLFVFDPHGKINTQIL